MTRFIGCIVALTLLCWEAGVSRSASLIEPPKAPNAKRRIE